MVSLVDAQSGGSGRLGQTEKRKGLLLCPALPAAPHGLPMARLTLQLLAPA